MNYDSINPCNGCNKRNIEEVDGKLTRCHSTCKEFKKWRSLLDKENYNRKTQFKQTHDLLVARKRIKNRKG